MAHRSTKKLKSLELSAFKIRREFGPHQVHPFVELTALGNVQSVYESLKNDVVKQDIIIGLDTMVCCGGKMHGKPKTKENAFEVIRKLTSCSPHTVYTGVVLMYKEQIIKFTETTIVYMEKLSEEEILAYVEIGEPIGKAGAHAIQ